jgi:hypothetical protein
MLRQRLSHSTLTAPGQDQPVASRTIREFIKIRGHGAFIFCSQMRIGESAGEPVVALSTSSKS